MKDHARVGLFHLIEGIDTGSTARRELEDRWLLKPWRSSSLIAAAALSPHPSTFEPPSIYVPTPSLSASCVLPEGVPQGQTESGGTVLVAICWATSAQRRCHPKEALYLPTFSHLFDCQ